jgi:hypothetical protein
MIRPDASPPTHLINGYLNQLILAIELARQLNTGGNPGLRVSRDDADYFHDRVLDAAQALEQLANEASHAVPDA